VDFLQPTAQPNLRVLTAGPLPPNPAELVGSQRLRDLLDRLQQEADLLVLDSPPAALLADTIILATQADGVILVIEVGRTHRDLAQRTLASLHQVQAHVAGVVLNRMPLHGAGHSYYHNYALQHLRKYRHPVPPSGVMIPLAPAAPRRHTPQGQLTAVEAQEQSKTQD
jgi:capsular exopolysaccharide synthesis family protein